MLESKKIAAVVPAYNEEGFIAAVIEHMPDIIDRIYIVDDASTDLTGAIVSGMAGQNSRALLLSHPQNKGVGAAIVTGYKQAQIDGIDIAVVMAGDNQMDGKALPQLWRPSFKAKRITARATASPGFPTCRNEPWRRFAIHTEPADQGSQRILAYRRPSERLYRHIPRGSAAHRPG